MIRNSSFFLILSLFLLFFQFYSFQYKSNSIIFPKKIISTPFKTDKSFSFISSNSFPISSLLSSLSSTTSTTSTSIPSSFSKNILVNLGNRSYPINIFNSNGNIESYIDKLKPLLKNKKVFIITNTKLNILYQNFLNNLFNNKNLEINEINSIILSDGEKYKNFTSINSILDKLIEKNYTRNSIIISFGGGVIGDLSGFASSIFLRGIKFIQIPTTLLSMIDSSIGGKTGINHSLGKNMIGTFYQPSLVLIDLYFLNTLPEREYNSGLSEIIKYGLMHDYKFFNWIEKNQNYIKYLKKNDHPSININNGNSTNINEKSINAMNKINEKLIKMIYKSCKIKQIIVEKDEKEENNSRILLNLGHTFGHSIETVFGYGEWLHGEAVALGMLMALEYSIKYKKIDGLIGNDLKLRLIKLYNKFSLPTSFYPLNHIKFEDSINKNENSTIKSEYSNNIYESTYKTRFKSSKEYLNELKTNFKSSELLKIMTKDKKNLSEKISLVLLNDYGQAFVSNSNTNEEILSILEQFYPKANEQ